MSIAAGSYQYQASRGSPPEKETKGQRPQQPHSQGSFTPSFSYYAPYYDSNSSPSNDYSTHNYYGPVYTGPVNYYAPVYTGSPVYTEPEYYSPSSRAPTVYSAPYEAPKPKILAPANALMTADGKRISVPVPDVFKAVKNVIESISKAYETMYLCPAGISGNVTSDADGLTVAPQEVLQKIFQKGDSIGGGYTVASSRFVPGSFRPGKKLKPVFFLHLTDAKGITFRVDLSCIKNISDSGNPFSLDRTNYEEHTYVTDGIYVWNCAAVWKGDKDKGLAATEKYKNEGLLTPIVQNTSNEVDNHNALFREDPINILIFLCKLSQCQLLGEKTKEELEIFHANKLAYAKKVLTNTDVYRLLMTLPKKVLIIRMLRAFGFGEAESNFNMLKETGVLRIVLLLLRMPEDTLFKNIKGTILTEIDELIDGDHTSLFQIFKAWDTQYDDTIKNHIDDHAIIAMLIPLTYKDINASNIDEIIQSVSSDYIYSRHRNDKITISPDEIKRHLETLFGKNISSSSSILIPKEKSDEVAAAPSAALAAHEEVPSPPCGMVVAPNAPEIARKKTERKIRKAEKRIKNAAEQMKAAEEARINAATEKAEQIRVAKEAKRKAAAEAEQTRIAQEERIKAEKIKLEEASSQIAAAPSQQKKKVIKKQISAAAPAPKIDPHKEFKLRNGIETFEVFKEGNSQCAEWVKQKNLSELILRSRIELSSFNTIYKIKFNDGSRFEGILIYEEIFDTMEERFIGLLDDTLFEGFHKKNSDGFYFDGRLYYKEKEKINDQIFYNFFFPGKPTGLESLKNKKSIQQFKLDTMKFNGIFRPHQNSFYYKNGEFSFSDERNFVCFDNSLKKGQEKMKSMEASFAAAEQAKELNENTKLCHIISSENDVSINEFLKKISISLLAGKVLISHFVKKDGRIYFNIKIVMEKNKLFTCVFHFSLDEENKNKSIIDVIKEIMFNRTTNFQDAQPYVLNNGSIFKFGEFILDKGELIVNENWKLCFEDGSYNRSLRIKTLKVVGDNSYEIIFNDNSEFKGKVVKNIFHGVLNGCQFRGTRTIDSETNTCYFNGQIQLNPDDIARFGIQDFITEKPVTFSGIFGFTDPGNKFILQEGRFIK